MLKITDYSFLFQSMFGTKNNTGVVNPLRVSSLSSGSVRAQLKAADPTWKAGKPIKSGALDGITRESIDSSLVKLGSELVKATSSGSSLDIQI